MSGHTVGVAVQITSPAREALEAVRARFEAGPGEMPPHVTILAPVDVDAEALPGVVAHLESVAQSVAPFSLTLRGTGSFRPVSPVVFVGVAQGAADCARLELLVRSGALGVDTRFPYHPHVTIAHDVDEALLDLAAAELAGYEATMRIDRVGLYEFAAGRWGLAREYPLSG